MEISHDSHGTFPHEGAWLGKAGIAAAGLMVGVTLGTWMSPWTVSPDDTALPAAASDPVQVAPAEAFAPEICRGGIEPVDC